MGACGLMPSLSIVKEWLKVLYCDVFFHGINYKPPQYLDVMQLIPQNSIKRAEIDKKRVIHTLTMKN